MDKLINRIKKSNNLRLIFSKIPDMLRRDYFKYKYFLKLIKNTEFLNTEELQKFQLKHLKDVVKYSWRNIRGYRELWEEGNFSPDKLKTLEDINLIPFLTKKLLRDNIDKFTNMRIKKKITTTTGGSTGISLRFYIDLKNNPNQQAFIIDMWSRRYNQVTRKTKQTVLRGRKIKGIYNYDPSNGLTLSSYDINKDNVQKYIILIEKYKTPIFQAYPSAIYLMAKIIKDNNLTLSHRFNLITLGSEPLYDFQKELLIEIFNASISHWYGQAERVVLAGNCEYSDRFHIYPQYGITEILDKNNKPVKEGEVGEIIGTSFWNYATPFIRYKTRDFAEFGTSFCEKCGRNYQLLNRIEGRLQEYLISKHENIVPCTGYSYLMKRFSNVIDSQFYQEKKGILIIKIVIKGKYTEKDHKEILLALNNMYKKDFDYKIEYVDKIPRTESGKLRFLEQKLNLNEFM